MLAPVFLVTALTGLFISNSATAVLIAPIAIDAARAARLTVRVCNNGFDRLLHRVRDTGIVRSEYASDGTGLRVR